MRWWGCTALSSLFPRCGLHGCLFLLFSPKEYQLCVVQVLLARTHSKTLSPIVCSTSCYHFFVRIFDPVHEDIIFFCVGMSHGCVAASRSGQQPPDGKILRCLEYLGSVFWPPAMQQSLRSFPTRLLCFRLDCCGRCSLHTLQYTPEYNKVLFLFCRACFGSCVCPFIRAVSSFDFSQKRRRHDVFVGLCVCLFVCF